MGFFSGIILKLLKFLKLFPLNYHLEFKLKRVGHANVDLDVDVGIDVGVERHVDAQVDVEFGVGVDVEVCVDVYGDAEVR